MAETARHIIDGVDQDLKSRDIASMGQEALAKWVKARILLIGLGSIGVEAAKNLALSSPKELIIYDPSLVTEADMGLNFFLEQGLCVGKRRDHCSVARLQELNPDCRVSLLPDENILAGIAASPLSAVIVTSGTRASMEAWNAACHAGGIPFIGADLMGAAGWAFSDFGAKHTIKDPNGEAPHISVVTGITALADPNQLQVQVLNFHKFQEDDFVTFSEVKGLTELNDGKPRKVCAAKNDKGRFTLTVELKTPEELKETAALVGGGGSSSSSSSSPAAAYTSGGMVSLVKLPTVHAYEPLSVRRCTQPVPAGVFGMTTMNMARFGQCEQLHVAFEAVELYRAAHGGALPPLRDPAAIAECIAHAQAFAAAAEGLTPHPFAGPPYDTLVNPAMVARVAGLASAQLPAIGAILGGIVAQEAVKITGKFTPLGQWLYVEGFDAFPEGADPALLLEPSASGGAAAAPQAASLPPEEFAPSGSRYDSVTAIFGRTLQAAVMNQRVFLVGSGALGCELLKNFALAGVGCGPEGSVTVTDMDRIEVSNLSRQFLFRRQHVGSSKSTTAAAAAAAMNPQLKVVGMGSLVAPSTETLFNDTFWGGLTLVVNALDNIKARVYVDGRCVWFGKPLLESGTLGAMGSTQVISPHVTESYADQPTQDEPGTPACTLKDFPYLIEHCIQWARAQFEDTFFTTAKDAQDFAAGPEACLQALLEAEKGTAEQLARATALLAALELAAVPTYQHCLAVARGMFTGLFRDRTSQLIHEFPKADTVKENGVDTGVLFWSGDKRFPTPADFSLADPLHTAFMCHAVALLAANFGAPLPAGWHTPEAMAPILAGVAVPPFVPKKKLVFNTNSAGEKVLVEDKEQATALEATLAQLRSKAATLGAAGLAALKASPAEFEKDDDSNHHIDFIAAAANLRAANYSIPTKTRTEVKLIAGKIIPALATTTCTVTGLVSLELYKVVGRRPMEALRSATISLAVNSYVYSEPNPPKKVKSTEYDPVAMSRTVALPEGHTKWDKFEVNKGAGRDMTFAELAAWLAGAHSLTLDFVTVTDPNPKDKEKPEAVLYMASDAAKGSKGVCQEYTERFGAPAGGKSMHLVLALSNAEGDDVLVPTVVYYFA